jgi:hypothetical protein
MIASDGPASISMELTVHDSLIRDHMIRRHVQKSQASISTDLSHSPNQAGQGSYPAKSEGNPPAFSRQRPNSR